MEIDWIEAIGYLAMVLVAVSIMMSSIVKLRVFNMCGAVVFIVYGSFIESYPVIILNAFLAFVNFYHLLRLKKV